MKKILFGTVLSVTALFLAACTDNSKSEAEPAEGAIDYVNTYEDPLAEEENEDYTEGSFGELYELYDMDVKLLEVNRYPGGFGDYDEDIFELVMEVTNKSGELASPAYLAQWNMGVFSDEGDVLQQVPERIPTMYPEEASEQQIARNDVGQLKNGGTAEYSIWFQTIENYPMYAILDGANIYVPIVLD